MIQKKICLVGMFGTGKTSLVKQFVYSKFSEKYHGTIGVKIDRKEVDLDGTKATLLLWDLAGRDGFEDVRASYLKGSAGLFFVADGTRRETFEQLEDLRALTVDTVGGDIPFVVALNKADLADDWELTDADTATLMGAGWHVITTSAKTGERVDEAFHWIAAAAVRG